MTHYKECDTGWFRPRAIMAASGLAAAAGLAALTHLSWNMFAPDLFGMPELRMKQAIGLVGFGYVIAVLLHHAWSRRAHG